MSLKKPTITKNKINFEAYEPRSPNALGTRRYDAPNISNCERTPLRENFGNGESQLSMIPQKYSTPGRVKLNLFDNPQEGDLFHTNTSRVGNDENLTPIRSTAQMIDTRIRTPNRTPKRITESSHNINSTSGMPIIQRIAQPNLKVLDVNNRTENELGSSNLVALAPGALSRSPVRAPPYGGVMYGNQPSPYRQMGHSRVFNTALPQPVSPRIEISRRIAQGQVLPYQGVPPYMGVVASPMRRQEIMRTPSRSPIRRGRATPNIEHVNLTPSKYRSRVSKSPNIMVPKIKSIKQSFQPVRQEGYIPPSSYKTPRVISVQGVGYSC